VFHPIITTDTDKVIRRRYTSEQPGTPDFLGIFESQEGFASFLIEKLSCGSIWINV